MEMPVVLHRHGAGRSGLPAGTVRLESLTYGLGCQSIRKRHPLVGLHRVEQFKTLKLPAFVRVVRKQRLAARKKVLSPPETAMRLDEEGHLPLADLLVEGLQQDEVPHDDFRHVARVAML